MKNTSNFFNEVYFGGDFGNTWQSIFKYSENWNSSSGWTLIFGKFSGEYELILLTTITNFYIFSQQYEFFKPNFFLRVLKHKIVVVDGHLFAPSILLFQWLLFEIFGNFHRIVLLFHEYYYCSFQSITNHNNDIVSSH